MTFYFKHPHDDPPTSEDCQDIAQSYGLWEQQDPLNGYFTFRGRDSYFTVANAYSVDPRSSASFIDQPFRREGGFPFISGSTMPSQVAPLCAWHTAELGPATGRTYLVGCATGLLATGADNSTLDAVDRESLQLQCDGLRHDVQGDTGYLQCHRANTARKGLGAPPHLLTITGCGVYLLTATQRRRVRRGRD